MDRRVTVEVIVPWRPTPHRDAAWEFCRSWWSSTGWKVTVSSPPDGPWCKAAAVTPAVLASSASVVVVADADVWCDGIPAAVEAVQQGALWAVPHGTVHRLDQPSTLAVLAGENLEAGTLSEGPYKGHVGGGLVVLPRTTYLSIPLDPRFKGWGQEDDAWGVALTALLGKPWRGQRPLWHLWHPPQPRRDRIVGSDDGMKLYRRYKQSRHSKLMLKLLAEVKEANHVDSLKYHDYLGIEASG